MIEQVSVFLENKSGRLAELTRTLGDAGINMHALMVADTSEFGVARVICDRPSARKALLDEAGFGASIAKVLAVEVPDRRAGSQTCSRRSTRKDSMSSTPTVS